MVAYVVFDEPVSSAVMNISDPEMVAAVAAVPVCLVVSNKQEGVVVVVVCPPV